MKREEAILCVDDEAISLLALKQELLEEFGDEFLVETALNADSAKEIIEELAQDGVKVILIISDWLMPGIKGDAFLSDVKKSYPAVRCIIISGQADEKAIEKAKADIKLDAYISKPWNHDVLVKAVKACIG